MIPAFDVDIYVKLMLPIKKRVWEWLTYIRCACFAITRAVSVFNAYRVGTLCDPYDASITYSVGSQVRDLFGVYISLQGSNTGNALTNTAYWEKRLDSYIGINEQANYCPSKIVYEFALNRWFGTVFRQYADDAYTHLSDIYITTATPVYPTFLIGLTEADGIGVSSSEGHISLTGVFTTASTYVFYIYVPTAIYNALGTTTNIREKTFRAFADRLCPAGITYSIILY
jgi:hypothetical protein